jgi:hypothetical protein
MKGTDISTYKYLYLLTVCLLSILFNRCLTDRSIALQVIDLAPTQIQDDSKRMSENSKPTLAA